MNNQLAIEYYNNGLQSAKAEKWDEALEFLNKAIAEDPKHVNAYNVLGKIYAQRGDVKKATRCWRMALRIDPENITARQCLAAAGKEPTRSWFKQLVWPAIAGILFIALVVTNLMSLQRISSLKAQLALARANQALARVPASPRPKAYNPPEEKAPARVATPVATQKAEPEQETKRTQPAEVAETVEVKSQKPEEPLRLTTAVQVTQAYNKALADCRAGKYDQAIEAFRQILGYPRRHTLKDNAQYWLAECYYGQKNYILALSEFEKVRRNFPKGNKVFDAELKVAYTYYKLGQIDEAKRKLAQLSKTWPLRPYRSRIAALSKEIQSSQSNRSN